MPLNIKDEVVHRKARELATLQGVSITAAVHEAIDDKLKAVTASAAPTARTPERLLALARVMAAEFPPESRSTDHADLYDDQGLP